MMGMFFFIRSEYFEQSWKKVVRSLKEHLCHIILNRASTFGQEDPLPRGHVFFFNWIRIIWTILVEGTVRSLKEHLCQIIFNSCQYFWTRRFLKFLQCTYKEKKAMGFFLLDLHNLNNPGRGSLKEHLCLIIFNSG